MRTHARRRLMALALAAAVSAVLPAPARGETGHDVWLRYAPLDPAQAARDRQFLPAAIVTFGDATPIQSARDELVRGLRGMLGVSLQQAATAPASGAVFVGTVADVRRAMPALSIPGEPGPEGFHIQVVRTGTARDVVVTGADARGVLYGAFALLRAIGTGEPIPTLNETSTPAAPVRWVDQWDNLNGTIERGYGGPSIFWENGHARADVSRVGEYGRLLASVGVNGVSINNVNADPQLLAPDRVPDIARIADAFRPWGIRVALAIDFGSPQSIGKLPTYDPLDPTVAAWWAATADRIYAAIPDFAGFVLKADSEGRVGPSTYGRTHADAANVVARALKPHGGLIFYRGFVYDHHMDWQNPKNDRARAAADNFQPLDGQFDDNAIVQIKNGPIDFQVREPASPLFSALKKTNEAIELQITQEYMGQARHLVFLPAMWKATLDFDLHAAETPTPVKAIVSGKTFHRPVGGFVGVANVGMDDDWFGNHMSQANLYGFGRLAWDPDTSARAIAEEWTRLTFGDDPRVLQTVVDMQLGSWRTYENYTGPLGLQTLTDIVGNHYGVAVEASEKNGWGQWHRADEKGVGMDRTSATGTGFIGQYAPAVAAMYESLATCPDDLVLFMHHVPYTHVLHDGKTVIQYIYDSHYDGADAVAANVRAWRALAGKVDDARYQAVLAQLEYQAGAAVVWRDAVTSWFLHESGIADAKGRVGHYPGRMEAEAADLTGYVAKPVMPVETASGGTDVECAAATCTAHFTYHGAAGRHDIVIQYFDLPMGASRFQVRVGNTVAAEWNADDHLAPTRRADGTSSTRRVVAGVELKDGDAIEITGAPNGGEPAALDYIEITPSDGEPVWLTAQ